MDVWFGFKYVHFLKALSRPCVSKRTDRGYCLLLDLIRIPHQIYTISVFSLHYVTFCIEFIAHIAGESGNLWISDRKLYKLYSCCNHLLGLMESIM